jgi:hypothetical protein
MVTLTSFPTTVAAVLATEAFICARTLAKMVAYSMLTFAEISVTTDVDTLVDTVVAELEVKVVLMLDSVVF